MCVRVRVREAGQVRWREAPQHGCVSTKEENHFDRGVASIKKIGVQLIYLLFLVGVEMFSA